jgi:hypothetical protein
LNKVKTDGFLALGHSCSYEAVCDYSHASKANVCIVEDEFTVSDLVSAFHVSTKQFIAK